MEQPINEDMAQKIKENKRAVKPEDPSREGYVFLGWYRDSDLTSAYNFAAAVTGDLTLYAKWKERIPGEIIDSWELIIASVNNGTYKNKYMIGDTKSLNLGSEGVVVMQIAAFDADELAENLIDAGSAGTGCGPAFAYMFIDKIRKEGYKAGIYSGDYNFLRNFNDINCDSKWVARYNNVPPQSNYDVWQYSSKGRLIGLTGNVDCNVLEDSSLFSKAYYDGYVDAILDNDYGTGVNRKNALLNEGINYWYVQTLVNKRLRGK